MSSFESTRQQHNQEHFEVLEIDLPVITGTCTLGSSGGFGTPLTCDQAWAGEYKTYRFTNINAPIIPNAYRVIKSISESAGKIKSGDGLGSRGTLSVTLNDFIYDPNIGAPGVTDTVKNHGTFFGKLDARQIMTNKEVRLKLYRVESDGTIDLDGGALTRYYLVDSLKTNGKVWTLSCKDELSIADIDEKTWPVPQGGYLRQDVAVADTTLLVDGATDYSQAKVVKVGSELFKVASVSNNLTSTATINIDARGSDIIGTISGKRLSRVEVDSHSAGDEVFICHVSDNERIDDLLARILTDADVDPARIPTTAWKDEIDVWHTNTFINTIWYSSEDVNNVLQKILTDFLIDLVFNPETRFIEMFAISVWRQSKATLTEGKEIDLGSVRMQKSEGIRTSRALVVYEKPYLMRSDDVENYSKASKFENNQIISDDLYGQHKDKVFANSVLLDKNSADLLVQRQVSRFAIKPKNLSWKMQESKLNISLGDVIEYRVYDDQGFDGSLNPNARGQVISINPIYSGIGREYKIDVASYEVAALDGSEYVISGTVGNGLSLHTLVGAPPSAVTVTVIFDAAIIYGGSNTTPSVFAGNFSSGSVINIVLKNSASWQSKGGDGGAGETLRWDQENSIWYASGASSGENGGLCYDAQGVETNIYLSGTFNTHTADGFLRAPSGGDGGFNCSYIQGDSSSGVSGNGGNGADGNDVGLGGSGGKIFGTSGTLGIAGTSGSSDGSTSGWGIDGANNDATGGLKGSGIITGGATVTVYGGNDTATDGFLRLINGGGDAVTIVL